MKFSEGASKKTHAFGTRSALLPSRADSGRLLAMKVSAEEGGCTTFRVIKRSMTEDVESFSSGCPFG